MATAQVFVRHWLHLHGVGLSDTQNARIIEIVETSNKVLKQPGKSDSMTLIKQAEKLWE